MEPAARGRLLDALLVELGEKGYGEMAIERPLRIAGVSMASFKAEFLDTDAALFAAYEQLIERLTWRATEACTAAGGPWPRRVHSGLRALLDELAASPQTAAVLTRAFPAIGPEARAGYQGFIEGLAPLLREGRNYSTLGDELPAEVEMLSIGAAEAIVCEEIEAGRAPGLPTMGPAILFSVLVPFLGPEAATAEMESARQGG
jgi:AcrR family transcriptional regulator